MPKNSDANAMTAFLPMPEDRKPDRSKWHPSTRHEWEDEPDQKIWVDEKTGYQCMCQRNPEGAWCGYVALPENHCLFKVEVDRMHPPVTNVHGGITLSRLPINGKFWVLGFDCAHSWDSTPLENEEPPMSYYRDLHYAEWETQRLARHLSLVSRNADGVFCYDDPDEVDERDRPKPILL